MTLECEHCGSHNYKIDYIEGYSGETEVKCMMCGRKKFKEVEMSKTMCMAEGCSKYAVMYVAGEHYCSIHGKAAFGVTKNELDEMKREIKGANKQTKVVMNIPTLTLEQPTDNLVINFEGYRELLLAIKENAHNEMRTPEMQVLWILKSLLDRAA
jgi:hypothetical protein